MSSDMQDFIEIGRDVIRARHSEVSEAVRKEEAILIVLLTDLNAKYFGELFKNHKIMFTKDSVNLDQIVIQNSRGRFGFFFEVLG